MSLECVGAWWCEWRCGVLEILCSDRHTRILASLFTITQFCTHAVCACVYVFVCVCVHVYLCVECVCACMCLHVLVLCTCGACGAFMHLVHVC